MKTEIELCNHRAKYGTLKAKKYLTPVVFLMWLTTFGLIWAMGV